MPRRIIRALVGGLRKPWKPKLSLPSYAEPTPETSRRLSREEEAELALTRTVFTPGTAVLLTTFFLLTIVSVPLIEVAASLRAGRRLPMWEMLRTLPSPQQVGAVRSLRDLWNLVPHAEELKRAENTLEEDSAVSQWLLPSVQSILVTRLGAGTEQVYLGRDGWLFYRPDIEYITGPGFLHPARLKQREQAARVTPDPIPAIVQFHQALASRGIELVVMPVPTKASIHPEKLSNQATPGQALQNASFAEFKKRVTAAGVRIFDPTSALLPAADPSGEASYLRHDTHWRPAAMQRVARTLAAFLALTPSDEAAPRLLPQTVTGQGDIARMLKLPAGQNALTPETVRDRAGRGGR